MVRPSPTGAFLKELDGYAVVEKPGASDEDCCAFHLPYFRSCGVCIRILHGCVGELEEALAGG